MLARLHSLTATNFQWVFFRKKLWTDSNWKNSCQQQLHSRWEEPIRECIKGLVGSIADKKGFWASVTAKSISQWEHRNNGRFRDATDS